MSLPIPLPQLGLTKGRVLEALPGLCLSQQTIA